MRGNINDHIEAIKITVKLIFGVISATLYLFTIYHLYKWYSPWYILGIVIPMLFVILIMAYILILDEVRMQVVKRSLSNPPTFRKKQKIHRDRKKK